MKCIDCPYYWKDEEEQAFSSCHYFYADNYAPCEIDENEAEIEEDDLS